MARVFALRKRLREPTAARSLARSLARSPRSAAPPLREKPHFKPFRPYERLRPRDGIELHLGAPAFEFASGATGAAAQPFSPEKHAREGMRRFCFALQKRGHHSRFSTESALARTPIASRRTAVRSPTQQRAGIGAGACHCCSSRGAAAWTCAFAARPRAGAQELAAGALARVKAGVVCCPGGRPLIGHSSGGCCGTRGAASTGKGARMQVECPQGVPFRTQHPLGVVVDRPSVWPDR